MKKLNPASLSTILAVFGIFLISDEPYVTLASLFILLGFCLKMYLKLITMVERPTDPKKEQEYRTLVVVKIFSQLLIIFFVYFCFFIAIHVKQLPEIFK